MTGKNLLLTAWNLSNLPLRHKVATQKARPPPQIGPKAVPVEV